MSESAERIWLIGGTGESAELARSLAALNIPCTVTVTTPSACALYPGAATLRIWVGQLTAATLPAFLQQENIAAILDASHPFAVEVSRLAIATAQTLPLPYLRFERSELQAAPAAPEIVFETVESLLSSAYLEGQRVLLTLGYRWLPAFQAWQNRATLFARILPSVPALNGALAAGFTPDRLIALRPPVSEALERALWQQWQVTCVVTKASGAAGGEAIKRQVAQALGVPLVVLQRPKISYPQQTDSVAIALDFCRQIGAIVRPASKQIR
ncbi:MAG: cobalt-precorrin-6A reductase [Cyanobacteria bacterium Co-bin13]|nr:cobalt-precorrin-6A reductase [Cyanobacteria bacterium Co-bin13]